MRKVTVSNSKDYDIIIKYGILDEAGTLIKSIINSQTAVIVTDDIVDKLYSDRLITSLSNQGFSVLKFTIMNGEASKNSNNYIKLLNYLAENKVTRSDVICALGGGVVGDLAGFVAATYLRGISFVQLPTTLLAAVDSSVGGKTAIDLECGKNLAGAFYQPDLVICDYSTLITLKDDVFRDGCAEVIKYGIIKDEVLFSKLLTVATKDMAKTENDEIENIIERCVSIKRDIVNEDERDNGIRQILNFGHTIGHAIEACSSYTISHGFAVAKGMAAVSKIAYKSNICSKECYHSICNIIESYGFGIDIDYSKDELYGVMTSDKKRSADNINIILPTKIGGCESVKMDVEKLIELLDLLDD